MRKLRIFFLCSVLLAVLAGLSAQTDEWAIRAGSIIPDFVMDIAVDAAGNSYITGYFTITSTFGTTTLTTGGAEDIYIAKLDPDGNWLWAVQAGGMFSDVGRCIAVDTNANVYIAGTFSGTAMFGIFPLTSAGGDDAFVAKLTTNGVWLWANRGGGTSYDWAYDIDTDSDGNCYMIGGFYDTANFGTSTLTSNGNNDVVIGKLNTNGVWQWATSIGGPNDDSGTAILADGSYYYVTGYFSGTAQFGPEFLTSAGNYDLFVCKLSGIEFEWSQRAGGTGLEESCDISTDGNGRINIAGYFGGTADFYVTTLYSTGNAYDAFVAQLDENGYWTWAVRAGGYLGDLAYGVATESSGDMYITGFFAATAHWGPFMLTSGGGNDLYIAKLDQNGNWLWVRGTGDTGTDKGENVAVNNSGSCFATGQFTTACTFGTDELTSMGDFDIYVAKLTDPTPKVPADISISNLGNDVIVDWIPVTEDTWNYPITPDYYFVYYNTDGVSEPYQYLTFIPGNLTEYVHQNAGYFSSNHFYQVTAVKFFTADRSGLEDELNANLRQGMTKEEVTRILHNLQK